MKEILPAQNEDPALSPAGPARSYSAAGSPADPAPEVLFEVVPGGRLAPRLAAAKAGDPLFVSPAFGGFPCRPAEGGPQGWLRGSELPADRRYHLCGGARPVVEVREQLMARGVPFATVLAEIYF